ncbi:GTA-gp10 family protein, partial [Oceanicella sp. SM1341]|uniref:GTA-gp10 family protein n=1 Tax=Oceanicella sp. SM1341 TaxID=1548889 RepID=UPI000E4B73C8
MANRLLGETELTVGGRTLRLVMDFNALCEFEEATGRNAVTSAGAFEAGTLTMRELRAFMWAALRRYHPETSLQDAGDLLGSHGEALGRAMGA